MAINCESRPSSYNSVRPRCCSQSTFNASDGRAIHSIVAAAGIMLTRVNLRLRPVAALIAVFICVGPLRAQRAAVENLGNDSQLRLTLAGTRSTIQATIRGLGRDSAKLHLTCAGCSGDTAIAWSDVLRVEVEARHTSARRALVGAGVGLGVGALAGAAVGVGLVAACSHQTNRDGPPCVLLLASIPIGGAFGAVIGTVIGLGNDTHHWRQIWPASG